MGGFIHADSHARLAIRCQSIVALGQLQTAVIEREANGSYAAKHCGGDGPVECAGQITLEAFDSKSCGLLPLNLPCSRSPSAGFEYCSDRRSSR
jgi:hypothetical protein